MAESPTDLYLQIVALRQQAAGILAKMPRFRKTSDEYESETRRLDQVLSALAQRQRQYNALKSD